MAKTGKRGVSPLIATVLLIAFAVALGAVVMNWGRQYVEDTTKFAKEKSDVDVKCSIGVVIEFDEQGGMKQICYNSTGSSVNFTLKNNGPSADISALQVRMYGQNGINITVIQSTLPNGYVARYGVAYPASLGNITKVEVVPQIAVQSTQKTAYCPKSSISEENLLQC
jgi:flagellin-like protein